MHLPKMIAKLIARDVIHEWYAHWPRTQGAAFSGAFSHWAMKAMKKNEEYALINWNTKVFAAWKKEEVKIHTKKWIRRHEMNNKSFKTLSLHIFDNRPNYNRRIINMETNQAVFMHSVGTMIFPVVYFGCN